MKQLIPDAALDRHVALLGMTGAGKTSVIKAAIVEPDLEADRRVLIITPKDDWWGLRLSRSGKSAGFDIPIFGGWHADYPLNVKDAALLGETYGTMKGSAILCTTRLSVQDRARWFAAFAEKLLSTNKGWLRVVIDEAHVFMPKQGGKGGGAVPMALHAGNELVSQGRSQGLRIVLASQRSAKLHNDSLTQCSCLMAMMLMAPHDRDAVKAWIEDQADPQRGHDIIASLAKLKAGEAWVWAPRSNMLDRIRFPMPKTFDSSAAPDDDAGDAPKLAPINLDRLKGKLAAVEAEQKANDPKELRAEVAKLRAEAADLQRSLASANAAPKSDPRALKAAERKGFDDGREAAKSAAIKAAHKLIAETLSATRTAVDGVLSDNVAAARKASLEMPNIAAPAVPAPGPAAALPPPAPRAVPPRAAGNRFYREPPSAGDDGALPSSARKMLAVIDTNPPVRRTWTQVATLAGLKARGGHYNTGRKALVDSGLVSDDGSLVQIANPTAGAVTPETDPAALVATWSRSLSGAAPRILQYLFEAGGQADQIMVAEALAMQPRGGHWNTSWKELRDNEIVTLSGGTATLTDLFMPR